MPLPSYTQGELQEALLKERVGSYARLRGGFPIPLSGAIYWLVLGFAGYQLELPDWSLLAFIGTGAIFPVALLLAKIFKNPFMTDKSVVSSVLIPAFISMLLFWAIIIAAAQEAPDIIPLILAVGLSLHWPVIGWSYGRTALFSAHAIVRALIVLFIWLTFPEHRLTWLPLSVAGIYLITVAAILMDTAKLRKR